ncbi:AraC-type DNA-binding protein [Clostridium gasigenes]|uniref:AraC-type DNA-binding protein n=2 Tax=Clostridium gasigenes TaxID=94869 RepID=A0A1H0LYS8_9CLOT|nr:AraC-type DNA-binding protein [Clostridium gasigenes]
MVKYCEKCDSRGGLEAIRLNEPYIYLCHYNIVDVAIPIIIDDKYIGAIMAGQVKLSDPNETKILEQIVTTSNKDLANKKLEDLKGYYEQLPLLSYEKVKELANMLSYLCNYLVEESIEKNLILQMYEKSLKSEVDSNALIGYPVKNIENVKKQISNAIIDSYIIEKSCDEGREVLVSTTLKPAIDYIYNNKSENISAENMANICHVSQGYFSRLFKKETGENFSIYLAKLKIEWAKNLLEETDMHVNEVSQELGFSESGYFIKIFKKYEGVTPSIYRKYFKKI